MHWITTIAKGLAMVVGALIALRIADANIEATNAVGAHAALIYGLCYGVIVGAAVIGHAILEGRKGLAVFLFMSLFAGEAANFLATGDRLVTAREASAVPLRAAAVKREEAIKRLADLEAGAAAASARTVAAFKAEAAAKLAVEKEASDGCKTECRRKQGLADKASAEVKEALAADAADHVKAIEAARAELKANPVPPSATPFADRLHVPAWAVDLALAALMSLAANGLCGALIAFASHNLLAGWPSRRSETVEADRPAITAAPAPSDIKAFELSDNSGQSDFPAIPDDMSNVVVGLFGNSASDPDGSPTGPKPGRRALPYKAQVCADLAERFRNRSERFESQEELKAAIEKRFSITLPKSTFSGWVCELEAAGKIPRRKVIGRCKVIG